MTLRDCAFIGGAPLTGKSTRAHQLAAERGAVVVATDAVRDWMQVIVAEQDRPALFFGQGLSVDELHRRFPRPEEVVQAQLAAGRQVQDGLSALLSTRYLPWERVVVEGIAVTPACIVRLSETLDLGHVDAVMLCHGEGTLRRRLRSRGLWTARPTPIADLEREAEWIELFDREMRAGAGRASIRVQEAQSSPT